MDTLRKIRPTEHLVEYEREIYDKQSIAFLIVEVKQRNGAIIVVKHHSDAVISIVLDEIELDDSGYIFMQSELDIDPINSPMVPHHRLATPEELRRLADRHIPESMLPVLRMKDPVRRWHNFPKGSVVVIERGSGSYFRRVT
jgi:DNA-directed RNA polymerase subunit H (RpoH/RPB5)